MPVKKTKKLYRSEKEKVIAGVAGGLAEYFNVDPVITRIIFVLLTLVQGVGLLLYIVLIFIVPKESEKEPVIKSKEKTKEAIKEAGKEMEKAMHLMGKKSHGFFKNTKRTLGFFIVILALVILINTVIPMPWFRWDIVWLVGLFLLGFFLIFKK